MIGGGGEKKTLRLVARYADESNLICQPHEVPRELDALAKHCETLGRNREITVSLQANVCVAPTHELALAEAAPFPRAPRHRSLVHEHGGCGGDSGDDHARRP